MIPLFIEVIIFQKRVSTALNQTINLNKKNVYKNCNHKSKTEDRFARIKSFNLNQKAKVR